MTERVLGIGGFFFRSKDPKALTKWYADHLGVGPLPGEPDYSAWQQQQGDTAFSPFAADSTYFGRAEQMWMLNFRVASLDRMVAQLTAAGIAVEVNPEVYDYGRFARLSDPEGNPIELWEPA